MANPSLNDRKRRLRAEIRMRLAGAPGTHESTLRVLRGWLSERPLLETIAAYSALPGEVDLASMIRDNRDRRWVFPRIDGDRLTLHRIKNPDIELVTGRWGIREPHPALPEVAVTEVDVFLCPGLAFDRSGGRLGRGRGYYDRLLATVRPDALKIGICHPAQLVEDTFSEPHDIPMDLVISSD